MEFFYSISDFPTLSKVPCTGNSPYVPKPEFSKQPKVTFPFPINEQPPEFSFLSEAVFETEKKTQNPISQQNSKEGKNLCSKQAQSRPLNVRQTWNAILRKNNQVPNQKKAPQSTNKERPTNLKSADASERRNRTSNLQANFTRSKNDVSSQIYSENVFACLFDNTAEACHADDAQEIPVRQTGGGPKPAKNSRLKIPEKISQTTSEILESSSLSLTYKRNMAKEANLDKTGGAQDLPEAICPDTQANIENRIVDRVRGNLVKLNATITDDTPLAERPIQDKGITQKALALELVQREGIIFVPQMKSFMVQYAVTLFPKETCQCPSTNTCYHILAARLLIGIDEKETTKTINLTQLRRNSRKRRDKKSGRKQPRKLDCDQLNVTPAPDSTFISEQINDMSNISGVDFIGSSSTPNTKAIIDRTPTVRTPKVTPIRPILKPETPSRLNVTPRKTPKRLRFEDDQSTSNKRPCTVIDSPPAIVIQDQDHDLNDLNETAPWLSFPEINADLKKEDHDILFGKGKINCSILNVVISLLAKRFPDINGHQPTYYSPIYNEEYERWISRPSLVFKPCSAPAVQIHHTGKDHWVTSVKPSTNSPVVLVDSAWSSSSITTSLSIQLAKIYGQETRKLQVEIPKIQRQPNGYDCGIYAAAHAVEFCFNGFCCKTPLKFKQQEMRGHLIKCLESKELTPFPKCTPTKCSVWNRIPGSLAMKKLVLYCCCHMPKELENMIQCEKCKQWHFLTCAGIRVSLAETASDGTQVVRTISATPEHYKCKACEG